ncbi:helix-turn-helix domain-containing protein [uncultured Thiodictyon sp.]|uniref:HVO_A0114 family putative DNA-binding protein n=1 Tax=uncultured Thiodictyon sp. TaxID=1846217 RepID=UPI0025D17D27|nr:helix-turn-helix domain-containing protein [uncultured Thiodictyon sp.]
MNAVTIGIASREETNARFMRAMSGEPQGAFRTIATVDDLWRTLTPKRWMLLRALTGAGPVSLREAARRVGRDLRTVETDIHRLLNAGLLEKTDTRMIEFPFDVVHVDFILRAMF